MGEIADKLVRMKESRRVSYLGNLRSLVDANTIEAFDQYFRLLTDYEFIEAKINHPKFGVQSLIEDYEIIENNFLTDIPDNHQEYNTETLENFKIIKQTLQLSAHVINQDTKQLAGQLTGRLLPFESQTTIQKLLQQISQTKISWLRPLTASLTSPGSGLIRTLTGHSSWIYAVAINSDGKYVVSGSLDDTTKIWEFATGKQVHTMTGHSSRVYTVAISSDAKYVVSSSGDNTIKIWELATGQEIITFTGEGSMRCCAITPDNATIIAGDALGKLYFLHLEGMEVQS